MYIRTSIYRILLLLFFFGGLSNVWAKSAKGKYTNAQIDSLYKEWMKLVDASQYQPALKLAQESLDRCDQNYYKGYGNLLYCIGYSYEYLNNNYDSAVYYYEKSYPITLKAKSLNDEVHLLMRLNYIYYYVKKFKERDALLVTIKKIVDTTKNINALAILNGSIGEYYLDNAAYENFIFYKLKAINYRKQLLSADSVSNRENIGVSYLQIVQAYNRMKQPEKALEYLNYSRDYIKSFRDGEAFMYNEYTNLFLQNNNMDSAVYYSKQLYAMMRASDSIFINLSYQRRLYADYYIRKNVLQKAITEAEEALRLAKKSTDEGILIEAQLVMAKVLYLHKDYQKSIIYLSEALPNAYSFDKEMYITIQKYLAQNYAAIGNWQQAYAHYVQYSNLQDTLYAESSKRTLAEVEARYQNKEKQTRITEQNIALSESSKQRIRLSVGLVLISVVAVLLVIIYRNKKKTADVLGSNNKKLQQLNSELEEANQTKAKLFSIISHDLRSPISQVYQFMNIQSADPDLLSYEEKTQLNSKIKTATGALLETMEDLLMWSKNQMHHFEVNLRPVSLLSIVDHCLVLLQLNMEMKKVKPVVDVPDSAIVHADADFLQAIVRNLLQNAIKVAPEGSHIYLSFAEGALFIKNEGGHFSQEQYLAAIDANAKNKVRSGLGLKLVDELSRKIDCTINFEQSSKAETIAKLTFQNETK